MGTKHESAIKTDNSLKIKQGRRAKAAIIRTGMQQGDFAISVLHVTPQHLSNVVTGKQNLTEDNARIIANSAGVRLEWLFCKDDYMTEEEIEAAAKKAEYAALDLVSKLFAVDDALEKALAQKLQFESLCKKTSISDKTINSFKKEVLHYVDYLAEKIIREALENGSDCETEE